MKELTKEQKLLAMVACTPKRAECAIYQCAISRFDVCGDPFTAGASLGFSRLESIGIMRGWDKASGNHVYFDLEANDPIVQEYEKLGAQCWDVAPENQP